jgi:hypothetical protein
MPGSSAHSLLAYSSYVLNTLKVGLKFGMLIRTDYQRDQLHYSFKQVANSPVINFLAG